MAEDIYDTEVVQDNWYKRLPYSFSYGVLEFYLPINPSNINITTHFATNFVATAYGTVEEHSDQRYYDIGISGTTGTYAQYFNDDTQPRRNEKINIKAASRSILKGALSLSSPFASTIAEDSMSGTGRKSFPVASGNFLGGFGRRTVALALSAINSVTSIGNVWTGTKSNSGLVSSDSGYMAFHKFYKFLLNHKKELMIGSSWDTVLYFKNYKDNNQYQVSVQTFTLTRSAEDPMLYNYSISMRAYNLQPLNSVPPISEISPASLGLDGVDQSLFSRISNTARLAKNAAYAAIAAVKGAGK